MIDLSFSSYFAFSLCLICSLFKESLLKGPSSNLFSTPPLQLTIINFEISKTREKKGHHCRDTQCTSFRMLKKTDLVFNLIPPSNLLKEGMKKKMKISNGRSFDFSPFARWPFDENKS